MRWLVIIALFAFAQVPSAEAQSVPREQFRLETMATIKTVVFQLDAERKSVRQAIRTLPPGPDRVAAFQRQAELNTAIFILSRRFFQAKNDRGTGPGFYTRLDGYLAYAAQFASAA